MRLGISQPVLAERCGVSARTQRNYESGSHVPDATYLAAFVQAGADLTYLVVGERANREEDFLSDEERLLLELWQDASPATRKAAVGALVGAQPQSWAAKQIFKGPVQNIAGRDVVHHAPKPRKGGKR